MSNILKKYVFKWKFLVNNGRNAGHLAVIIILQ